MLEGFHYFFHPVTQRAFELAGNGTIGDITHVEVRMAMPTPGDDDPRWSLELAGGALMDLGCYGLHVMRSLGRLGMPGIEGRPSIVRVRAAEPLGFDPALWKSLGEMGALADVTAREVPPEGGGGPNYPNM